MKRTVSHGHSVASQRRTNTSSSASSAVPTYSSRTH